MVLRKSLERPKGVSVERVWTVPIKVRGVLSAGFLLLTPTPFFAKSNLTGGRGEKLLSAFLMADSRWRIRLFFSFCCIIRA